MAGGVVDGQPVDQAVTNPAFIIKNADDVTPSNVGLASANPIYGPFINSTQREHNAASSFVGMAINQVYNFLPTWAQNFVGAVNDSLFLRVTALVARFSGSTGHTHSGVDGQGPQVASSAIGGTPLVDYLIRGSVFGPLTGGSVDVSLDFASATASSGPTVEGVVVTFPNNKVFLRQSGGASDGKSFVDGGGQEIYGRLTKSGSVWTLTFYHDVAGFETAWSFSGAVSLYYFYQKLFNPLATPPVYSTLPDVFGNVGGGGGGGGGSFVQTSLLNNQSSPVPVTGFLLDSTISNGFKAEYTVLAESSLATSDGTEDTAFATATSTGFDQNVFAVVVQSTGKIIIGGNFQNYKGVARGYIVRLNADYTEDTSFFPTTGAGFDASVNSIEVQSDDKIVVGGAFTTLNGSTIPQSFVRLNSDGTEDTTFSTNVGTGFNQELRALAIQPSDGKILAGGVFSSLSGNTRQKLVRFNSDGTEDTSFYTTMGSVTGPTVEVVVVQPDGKILVGGLMNSIDGGTTTTRRIGRLNTNGSLDSAFTSAGGTGFPVGALVTSISLQSTGAIVVGGLFVSFNGSTSNNLLRLSSGGAFDSTFAGNVNSLFNGQVNAVRTQTDDRVIVGGVFTTTGTIPNAFARINSDGTEDATFDGVIAAGFTAFAEINHYNCLLIRPNNSIIIGGGYTLFKGNSRNYIAALLGTGGPGSITRYNEERSLRGVYVDPNWEMGSLAGYIGSTGLTGVDLFMDAATGQVNYTSGNLPGVVTITIRFLITRL